MPAHRAGIGLKHPGICAPLREARLSGLLDCEDVGRQVANTTVVALAVRLTRHIGVSGLEIVLRLRRIRACVADTEDG